MEEVPPLSMVELCCHTKGKRTVPHSKLGELVPEVKAIEACDVEEDGRAKLLVKAIMKKMILTMKTELKTLMQDILINRVRSRAKKK